MNELSFAGYFLFWVPVCVWAVEFVCWLVGDFKRLFHLLFFYLCWLVLVEFEVHLSADFSVVPGIVAIHSVPAGPFSPRGPYNCYRDCKHSPSNRVVAMQIPNNFLASWKTHCCCVSPQVSLVLFCWLCEILSKPEDFVVSSLIAFPSSNLPPYGPCPFRHIWHMCVVLYRFPSGDYTFGISSTSEELGRTDQPSLHNSLSSPSWECGVGWILRYRCWFLFFFAFSVILFMFMTPDFPISSVANTNSLLLIIPLEVLSFSCR